jgi:hypothetical protein
MPPQQPDRLLDVIDEGLDFRAHDGCSEARFTDPDGSAQLRRGACR